ncbi:hypothetical protein [Nocardia brasiliensis]|uniref:hypothetical protein n=1 Tax=Nocardia brasiliensis TaxID=37326 RepID=UPI0024552EFE|nr:hypothetical protein [Nocardia brasiliensis]
MTAPTPATDPTAPAPTPADMPGASGAGAPDPAPPAATPAPAALKTDWTPEEATRVISELRAENSDWRRKYQAAEPIVKEYEAAQEAAKTEAQRERERADAAEKLAADREAEANLLRAASKHKIPEEDWDLLGSGTPEELDARAAKLASRYAATPAPTPPPSDRPVEGLRPGASPTPPAQPDNSYPESWRPAPPRGRS